MGDVRDPSRDQPLPKPGQINVQRVLAAVVMERETYGRKKYGRPLETHNGRDALKDAWEEAVDLTTHLTQMRLERGDDMTEFVPDEDQDELVCVDQCGACDACGFEPFGTPGEGWREAARFLRRTPRNSIDFLGALRGARLIEDELRRRSEEKWGA